MKVKVLREAGYTEALLGLSLSYNTPLDRMPDVALRLARKGGSHAKFLEGIVVWLDMKVPRYFWQQFDTYRVGVTKQSESTMHTVMKRELTYIEFDGWINADTLRNLNYLIKLKDFAGLKAALPEGFLQRRIVCLNYKVLKHIIGQRHNHRLTEWQIFCQAIQAQVQHKEFLI